MRDDEETQEFSRLGDDLFGELPAELPAWSPPPPVKIFVNAMPLPMHSAPFERVDLELVTIPLPARPADEAPASGDAVRVITIVLFLICCFSIGASIALLACR